jgi:hypothetical protein
MLLVNTQIQRPRVVELFHTHEKDGLDLALSKLNFLLVRISQETQYISATETSLLMLFGETVDVYREAHAEPMHYSLGAQYKVLVY